MLGPWPVSGVAQHVGAVALEDMDWANETRQVLSVETARLDALVQARGRRADRRHGAVPAVPGRRRRGLAGAARARQGLEPGLSL